MVFPPHKDQQDISAFERKWSEKQQKYKSTLVFVTAVGTTHIRSNAPEWVHAVNSTVVKRIGMQWFMFPLYPTNIFDPLDLLQHSPLRLSSQE